MKCKDCPYLWVDVDEYGNPTGYESCHYVADDGYAPCEVEDNDAKREPELDEYD